MEFLWFLHYYPLDNIIPDLRTGCKRVVFHRSSNHVCNSCCFVHKIIPVMTHSRDWNLTVPTSSDIVVAAGYMLGVYQIYSFLLFSQKFKSKLN